MYVTTDRRVIAATLYAATLAAGGAAVYVARKVTPGTVAVNRMALLLAAGLCLVCCSTAGQPPERGAEE